MKALTAAQMREVDRRTTEERGVPSLTLMENAGARVVEYLRETVRLDQRAVWVLCGKGNNGGDGLVVARLLRRAGFAPRVALFAPMDAVQGDAAVNLKRWCESGGTVEVVTSAVEWERIRAGMQGALLIDALLGTGLQGPAKGLIAEVIEDINRMPPPSMVVAVDIPSGLPSDDGLVSGPVVKADHTVTFTAPKLGHLADGSAAHVGKLAVRQIGTPPEMLAQDENLKTHWTEPSEFVNLPLGRRLEAHKGDFGHVLVVAGSRGKTGAAALAALGAMRIGAGLVTVATPDCVLPVVAAYGPEFMTEPLASTDSGSISAAGLEYGRFARLLEGKSVLAIGPGLSMHPETQQFVRTLLSEFDVPAIVDADGLNAFAGRADQLRHPRAPRAITPHPGEMARLLGCGTAEVQKRRLECAREVASRLNAFVVLKGHRTVVAAPDGRAFINSTGNPWMASGGMGDVLTGVLAGLTAQFGVADWARVLSLGVYLHGLAGDLRAAEAGSAPIIARDVLGLLGEAWRRVAKSRGRPA